MELSIYLIRGKWKTVILWNISNESLRFGELCRRFPNATQKVLTEQLRELEKNGLLLREVYPEVPLRVEYSLTKFGKTLLPILTEINKWGQMFLSSDISNT
jgi:DNA-binding HxlR family transcriptional regulator